MPREGIFAKVLIGGEIQIGDGIEIVMWGSIGKKSLTGSNGKNHEIWHGSGSG